MPRTKDKTALDTWCVVGRSEDVLPGRLAPTRLLGQDLIVERTADGAIVAWEGDGGRRGRELPVQIRYGHVWTVLGTPARDILEIGEHDEPDRHNVTCGGVRVRASAPRLVENFLDMAHFPFVHTDILGVEDHAEVMQYEAEIRRDVDEVWATKCQFYQPQAAKNAEGGQMSDYTYRVTSPFTVILYKTCPSAPDRMDVIGLLVQPVEEDRSIAFAFMSVVDATSSATELIQFQQMIFLQDRIILENQRPRLLPLDPRAETPTRADLSSIAYRRWLKDKGLSFGIFERRAA